MCAKELKQQTEKPALVPGATSLTAAKKHKLCAHQRRMDKDDVEYIVFGVKGKNKTKQLLHHLNHTDEPEGQHVE